MIKLPVVTEHYEIMDWLRHSGKSINDIPHAPEALEIQGFLNYARIYLIEGPFETRVRCDEHSKDIHLPVGVWTAILGEYSDKTRNQTIKRKRLHDESDPTNCS